MTLNGEALRYAARIGNNITIHRCDHSSAIYELQEVSQDISAKKVAMASSPELLDEHTVAGISLTALCHDDECATFFQEKEKVRISAGVTLDAHDSFWENIFTESERVVLADAVAAAAHSISDGMLAILCQMNKKENGLPICDKAFQQRWALPLALLCGKYQRNSQCGFVYWLSKSLDANSPEYWKRLIQDKPAVWLEYMYQCSVIDHYDTLVNVLNQLIDTEPGLVCDALLYLCTLHGLNQQADVAWQLHSHANRDECALALSSLLLYFPVKGATSVYQRYCMAVEQMLSNYYPSAADDSTAFIFEYQRLHGYMFALNASFATCFISKSEQSAQHSVDRDLELDNNNQTTALPHCGIKMVDNTIAKITM